MNKQFIELPSLTIKALFEHSIAAYADKPALSKVDDTPMTYSELKEDVVIVREFLKAYGIRRGDKVALYSENMPNWGIVYFAVTTMGAVIVPILPDFHESEVRHIIRHAECKALFLSEKLFDTIYNEYMAELTLVVRINTLEVIEELSSPNKVGIALRKGEETFRQIKSAAMSKFLKEKVSQEQPEGEDAEVCEDDQVCEDDIAAIIYTSGTTGSSKGVVLSHKNITFEASAAQMMVDIYPKDRFLSILPMAHTFECTVGFLIPVFNGASVYYIDKAPTPTILIKAMASVKPTFMLSVPLIIEKIYKNKIQPNFQKNFLIRALYNIGFVRKILNKIAGKKLMETFGGELLFFGIGGAALSPHVEAFLREAEFPYCIGYGLTETAPILAGTRPELTRYRAIGPALHGVELKIADPDEHGVGTLWARGPNVMQGYYKNPEKTAEVLKEDGWFNTEDLGFIDEDGYLYLSGRSKNVIIGPGGENIYPEQIEAAINLNEFVADALVYEDDGRLCARVHLDYEKLDAEFGIKGKSETKVHEKIEKLLEEMRQDLNTRVSSFSRVRKFIEQREPFVKTPTKKIKRYLYTEPAR